MTIHHLAALDVGREIDLALARRMLPAAAAPEGGPYPGSYVAAAPGGASVEVTVFDFGAVVFRTEGAPLGDAALAAARAGVVAALGPAVRDPGAWAAVERYEVTVGADIPSSDADTAARLRPGRGPLSDDEVRDAVRHRVGGAGGDAAVTDVERALVASRDPAAALAVLAFVLVQSLEARFLDERLDEALRTSYERLGARRAPFALLGRLHSKELDRVARARIDAAMLFEHVRNPPKLLDDPYLVRLYEAAAVRLRLPQWTDALLHKLDTLGTVYEGLRDRAAITRAETLEWIVILLILVSIVFPFLD
ncbi:MAG: hypothetical protein HMLKMBBP_01583 [Planctomycetes bacterium]|nr:hypothetical protein [Planctomycetota bacterium]